MDLTEKKRKTDMSKAMTFITNGMDKAYPTIDVGNENCYKNQNDVLFNVDTLKSDGAFVVEYANNIIEAKHNMFEDGDLFFLEDYNSLDEIFQAMCDEIDSSQKEL